MEAVVDVWRGKNGNGNVVGTMDIEEVCVLDRDRVVGVKLYKIELLLGWIKRWSYGAMEIVIFCVTKITSTTEEHVSCCNRW